MKPIDCSVAEDPEEQGAAVAAVVERARPLAGESSCIR